MHGPMNKRVQQTFKAKSFKKSWMKLLNYSKKHILFLSISLILVIGATILQIIGPDYLKQLTDEITKGVPRMINGLPVYGEIDLNVVINIATILALFYGLMYLFRLIASFILATVTQRISRQMRSDISNKINTLPLGYFQKTSYGDILSRVTNDIDTIGHTLNQSIDTLIIAITMFIGSIIMMFYTNYIMALTAIGASLFGFIFMIFIIKNSQKFFKRQAKELGRINGYIEEAYSGHHVIKAYNAGDYSKKSFESINEKMYDSGWKGQFFSGLMMPLMGFIGNLGYVAVSIVGATLAAQNKISFGVIVAFMIYVRLFTQPLSQFAQAANTLQRTAASAERIFEFLEEVPMASEVDKPLHFPTIKGDVEFRNVKFSYIEGIPVIHNFSASIKSGQKIAIVGPTGAGKTTLVNLLMRFYELDEGSILIDGIDISTLQRKAVHEAFSMVLQDTWLFEGSIKENIKYSKQDVTDEEIINACKAVNLDHFIRTLPDGYNTILNENMSLSEGQKQLLTIARAIVKDAPLLILDEATSSVDTRTEKLVQEAMDILMKGRTSFVIAHRLSTIKNADLILVIKEGDIIESGNHETLLSMNGYYKELYQSQFEL